MLANGTVKGLTILVNFQDVASTVTRADVDEMLNGANYTRNGNICSVSEYFRQVSSGKLDYTNVVVGPYKLSRNREFYVNNLLVEEALQLARGRRRGPDAVRLAATTTSSTRSTSFTPGRRSIAAICGRTTRTIDLRSATCIPICIC